jgi:hypothetical protein
MRMRLHRGTDESRERTNTDLGVLEDIGFDWETDENGRIVNAKIDLKVRPRQAAQSGQRVAPASNG